MEMNLALPEKQAVGHKCSLFFYAKILEKETYKAGESSPKPLLLFLSKNIFYTRNIMYGWIGALFNANKQQRRGQ